MKRIISMCLSAVLLLSLCATGAAKTAQAEEKQKVIVIDAGHHGLEHIFVPYMEQWLKENCPEIQTVTDDNQSPFFVI